MQALRQDISEIANCRSALERDGFVLLDPFLSPGPLAALKASVLDQIETNGEARSLRMNRDYPGVSLETVVRNTVPAELETFARAYFDEDVYLVTENTIFRHHDPEDVQYHVTFHQDGTFIAEEQCLIVWIALDACGTAAPGLEIVVGNREDLLPVSPVKDLPADVESIYDGINIDIAQIRASLGDDYAAVVPDLEIGDVVMMTPNAIHRTHYAPDMSKPRTALVIRLVSKSTAEGLAGAKLAVPLSYLTRDRNPAHPDAGFSLQKAREYWRHAPVGGGKISSLDLLKQDDEAFLGTIDALHAGRAAHYWEDRHFVSHFAALFSGKRVLSFGSGIGHNEIPFLSNGARLTCADIVQENLDVIERMARLKGLPGLETRFLEDPPTADYGGPYDYVFARGSLHHMPFALQLATLERFRRSLEPGGLIILNLYTDAFLERHCGFADPRIFALATDPSAGGTENPWSEAYDDDKLIALCGETLSIRHKQAWNNGLYCWWALGRRDGGHRWDPFLDIRQAELAAGDAVLSLGRNDFELVGGDAEPRADGGDLIRSDETNYGYILISRDVQDRVPAAGRTTASVDRIKIDVEIEQGGIAVGILDQEKDVFTHSFVLEESGISFHPIEAESLPARHAVIVSNFSPRAPGRSLFRFNGLSFLDRG